MGGERKTVSYRQSAGTASFFLLIKLGVWCSSTTVPAVAAPYYREADEMGELLRQQREGGCGSRPV